jgi:hypothetical protein
MTDPERVEEPRPDRLPEIKNGWLAARRLPEDYDDLDWLVAEVERMREDNEILNTAIGNLEDLVADLSRNAD